MATSVEEPMPLAGVSTHESPASVLPSPADALLEHRWRKLFLAGYSDEIAREIANEQVRVIDSDDAVKAYRAAEQVYENPEAGALYLLGLRDDPPTRN